MNLNAPNVTYNNPIPGATIADFFGNSALGGVTPDGSRPGFQEQSQFNLTGRLTYQSDFDEAERTLVAAARAVTGDIVDATGEKPFVRAELFDSGIYIRLRYQTLAKERQRISSDIVRIIIREFKTSARVEFCYPHLDVFHAERARRRAGEMELSPTGPLPDPA